MNRRRFIQTTLGLLVVPLVVPENPYKQLGFTNITDMRRNGEHLFYDVFVYLDRGNIQDGWLSISKYKDTYVPPDWKKKYLPQLPERPWTAAWQSRESEYCSEWVVYGKTERDLIRQIQRKFT